MSKCITPAEYQQFTAQNDFMVLFGENNHVYHFKDWDHPDGWNSTLEQFAGKIQDSQSAFESLGLGIEAKKLLEDKNYGYLSMDGCDT